MTDLDRYKNKEKRKQYQIEWKKNHLEAIKRHQHKIYLKRKTEALLKVGDGILKCSRCGSDKFEWLEINHINRVSYKERRKTLGYKLFRQIADGRINKEGFNILCRPCNLIEAAEKMSGRKYIIAL